MRRINFLLKGRFLVLLAVAFTGCDALEDIFENEKEAQGIIETIDDNALTVDGVEYRVTEQTEFEGFDALSDLSEGDEVEIEYKEEGGTREAIEIELAGAEDEDD